MVCVWCVACMVCVYGVWWYGIWYGCGVGMSMEWVRLCLRVMGMVTPKFVVVFLR